MITILNALFGLGCLMGVWVLSPCPRAENLRVRSLDVDEALIAIRLLSSKKDDLP